MCQNSYSFFEKIEFPNKIALKSETGVSRSSLLVYSLRIKLIEISIADHFQMGATIENSFFPNLCLPPDECSKMTVCIS